MVGFLIRCVAHFSLMSFDTVRFSGSCMQQSAFWAPPSSLEFFWTFSGSPASKYESISSVAQRRQNHLFGITLSPDF